MHKDRKLTDGQIDAASSATAFQIDLNENLKVPVVSIGDVLCKAFYSTYFIFMLQIH
jgi:hypothetical protein